MIAPATGGGPVGAGPGDAGKSSVHAGLGGTELEAALIAEGAGSCWEGGGIDAIVVAAATRSTLAEAIAAAGLAKSALGLVECNGESFSGESGIWDWVASTAALFPKGLAEGGPDW
jgi:hypothetical protein